jgi:glycosyltransferase involved in cell wall biosynthesis
MRSGWAVGVIVPALDEAEHIVGVIEAIPEWVDAIVVVNDHSSDDTKDVARRAVEQRCQEGWEGKGWVIDTFPESQPPRKGVGATIEAGMQFISTKAGAGSWCQGGQWCVAVMDGDGQMDAEDLSAMLQPIIDDSADHVKGSRQLHPLGLTGMPIIRQMGSWILTQLTNLATGLSVSDPQSGYAVSSHEVIEDWDWERHWDGYGYPNHRLLQLSLNSWRISEVPVKAIYHGQNSDMNIFSFFLKVSALLWFGLLRRGSKWYIDTVIKVKTDELSSEESMLLMWFGAWLGLVLASIAVALRILSYWQASPVLLFFAMAMYGCRLIDKSVATDRADQFYAIRRGIATTTEAHHNSKAAGNVTTFSHQE